VAFVAPRAEDLPEDFAGVLAEGFLDGFAADFAGDFVDGLAADRDVGPAVDGFAADVLPASAPAAGADVAARGAAATAKRGTSSNTVAPLRNAVPVAGRVRTSVSRASP